MNSHPHSSNPFDSKNKNALYITSYPKIANLADYASHLQNQFAWLSYYLPQDKLSTYVQLVAFSNFNNLEDKMLMNLQLRDLHKILALWNVELMLTEEELDPKLVAQIDTYVCSLTQGFCKRGLVTNFDLLRCKYEIFRDLLDIEDKGQNFSLPDKISHDLKVQIKNLLSLSIS